MGYREIYEYIEDHRATNMSTLCNKFDLTYKKLLDILRPLIISHKLILEKDWIKYNGDTTEEIPE